MRLAPNSERGTGSRGDRCLRQRGICRDPKDECILECAERAEAERIVSGDHHPLSLASYRGIRIMTAREYVQASVLSHK